VSKRDLRPLLPPGPSTPAAIQLIATWKRPGGSLEKLRRRYGKRISVQLPFQPPFVILSDPGDIKELFMAPPDVLHPGEGAGVLEPLIGRNSVILLDEDLHLEQRKLMLPAFHGEKMKRLTGTMTELAERELSTWPVGEPVALHTPLQRVTLEIILRAVFGLDRGPQLDDLRDLLTDLLVFTENPLSVLPALRRVASWTPSIRRFDELRRRADELMFELVRERRAAEQAGDADGDDILAMLLQARHEDGSPMSADELRDELMTTLVAGHETTASQLAWAFERLAREPAVVARLAQEIDEGQSEDYLTATIYEVLRRRPVLPNAEPRLTTRPVTIGGFQYPAGVSLLASAYLVHHDPEIYPEPYAFRPERFLGKAPGTYTWIPFGGGRRRCLGASFAMQEMKIVLRAAVARFELSPGRDRPERTARRSITFSPDGGATVVLSERRPAGEDPGSTRAVAAAA
jgi:cytochrome P450